MTGSNSDDSQETAGAMRRRKEDFLAIMSHAILTQVSELLAKGILLLDSPLNPVRHRHVSTLERCVPEPLFLLKAGHECVTGGRHETGATDPS